MSNFVAIILACLNCRIYPKLKRVFSRSCAATDSRRLSSKSEGKFFLRRAFISSNYSTGAFLWDDLDQDQWSEITRIMMHQGTDESLPGSLLRCITIRMISWPGSFQRNEQHVNDTGWDNTFRFGFCQVVFLTNRADCFYNALYQAHFIFNSAVFPRKLKREQNRIKNTFLITISRCTEEAKTLPTL